MARPRTFDAVGRMLTDTQAGNAGVPPAVRSYAWNAAGELTSRTDRNGRTIAFGYDALGRQTQQLWLDGEDPVNTITTVYDASLQVASIVDDDSANSFTWDSMGRLLTVSNAGTTDIPTVVQSYAYDGLGRKMGHSATINGVADFVNSYGYDSASRMTSITQTDGAPTAGSAVADKRVDLTYDSASRFATIARYESLTTTNAVASSTYAYDTAGRITSLQHASGATSLAGYSFTWDTADRLTSINSIKDGLATYSYDATNQLTAADHSGQTDEAFAYDANGNRKSTPHWPSEATIGPHNRILNDGQFTFTYDAEGNRTSRTDNATGAKVEYSWNHANQLTAVVYSTRHCPSGAPPYDVVTKSVTYRYDALGRRISKSVDETGNGSMDRSEHYLYDGAGLLTSLAPGSGGEGRGEGAAIVIAGPNGATNQHGWTDQMVLTFLDADGAGTQPATLATRNLYGPAVDQIFATEVATGDLLWALTDHLGTPRDWAERNSTTNTTSIAIHTRYTSFGAVSSTETSLSLPISPSALLHSFTGQLHDPDADLMYYRARWFDPALGKFLSDDPMGFGAGDANVSRYVGNAATGASDPTGLSDWTPWAIWYRLHGHRTVVPPAPNPVPTDMSPWHYTRNRIVFPVPTNMDPAGLRDDIYLRLKTFRDFNGGQNDVSTVDVSYIRGTAVARFNAMHTMGQLSDIINDDKVPVLLTYDDDSYSVYARTADGHMLVGERKWKVQLLVDLADRDTYYILVETASRDQAVGIWNNAGSYWMGEYEQLRVWRAYLDNIAEHYNIDYKYTPPEVSYYEYDYEPSF